jgi:purine nucleosidase/pyrimidine-specific ribonucleoside hydrolase
MAVPIILDCDPGHDDAIAMLLALASPEIELVGVTTVAGNQTLEKTTATLSRSCSWSASRRSTRPRRASAHP